MENIEAENRYFKQMTGEWSKKPLSKHDIDRRKVASMIYSIYQNNGRGLGFTEGKPSETNSKSCSDCIKKV